MYVEKYSNLDHDKTNFLPYFFPRRRIENLIEKYNFNVNQVLNFRRNNDYKANNNFLGPKTRNNKCSNMFCYYLYTKQNTERISVRSILCVKFRKFSRRLLVFVRNFPRALFRRLCEIQT